MKLTRIVGILCLLAVNVYAQKNKAAKKDFGDVSMFEMEMKQYSKDTTAAAVVLFDKGDCTIKNDLSFAFKRHIRIKFFSNKEVNTLASVKILYPAQGADVSKLKGSSYNLINGKIVATEMNPSNVFRKKFTDDYMELTFTMPNVNPGAVIEYSYIVGASAVGLSPWEFQHTVPTIYTEYQTSIPNAMTFMKDFKGTLPPPVTTSDYEGHERMVMVDVPAFKVEPFLTTEKDYISSVNFNITEFLISRETEWSIPLPPHFVQWEKTWQHIAKNLYNDGKFVGVFTMNAWLDPIVAKAVGNATKEEDKAKRIHAWVRDNVEWDKTVRPFAKDGIKSVVEDREKANSGQINMLLIAMLKKAGLTADPVLISTRDHGIIRIGAPNRTQFNDVVCYLLIDGKPKVLDATDKTLSFNALPERVLNGAGFLINNETGSWVNIQSGKAKTSYTANLKLDADGTLSGTFAISRDGLHAGQMRSSYNKTGEAKYIEQAFNGNVWDISKTEFKNLNESSEPVQEKHDVLLKEFAQVAANTIYLNPFLAGREENVFKSPTRDYPVDMPTAFDHFYSAQIEIPAGFKAEELPAPKVMVVLNGGAKFVYSATVMNNTINFVSQLSVNRTVINVEDYPALREFYALIVAKQAEQIVLKKT